MAEPANADHIEPEPGEPWPTAESATGDTRRDGREEGLVIAISKGYFEVSNGVRTTLCTLRGKLRVSRPAPARRPASPARFQRAGQPTRQDRAAPAIEEAEPPIRIAPGDHVLYRAVLGDTGVIEEVLPRRTVLSRARSESSSQHVMLANLDHAALVFAVRNPKPHFGMLDRYLALCEHAQVAVTICLNKVDLSIPEDVASAADLYAGLGYRVLLSSATTGAGVDALRELLAGRVSLLTGPSGVGKSSLMNELIPTASQRTAEISEATGKGRHTTTGVRLLRQPEGGWLADSAGIRELALWNVPSEELAQAFVELRPYADQCEYEDCDHSPDAAGCALRLALAEGAITPDRFASFERLLDEAREAEAPEW